jgi:large subunit ribosomal protein L6
VSRIGKVPIKIPKGVAVTVTPEMVVRIKGPKGEVSIDTKRNVKVGQTDGSLTVERHTDEMQDRAFHGLYHRLISGGIVGVTNGYTKELELVGVGYKADFKGQELVMNVGKSHEVRYRPPTGITVATPNPTRIVVSGVSKQAVGQEAARLRAVAPPEPYKGKGVRYVGEMVRRKVGKSGAK